MLDPAFWESRKSNIFGFPKSKKKDFSLFVFYKLYYPSGEKVEKGGIPKVQRFLKSRKSKVLGIPKVKSFGNPESQTFLVFQNRKKKISLFLFFINYIILLERKSKREGSRKSKVLGIPKVKSFGNPESQTFLVFQNRKKKISLFLFFINYIILLEIKSKREGSRKSKVLGIPKVKHF
jgi:hypothetical protein